MPIQLSRLCLVAGCVVAAAAAGHEKGEVDARVEGWLRSVCLISDSTGGSGTGFVVAPDVIATNSHVICRARIDDLRVRFLSDDANAKPLAVTGLLYEAPRRDLALIRVESPRAPLALSRSPALGVGRRVVALGNPDQGEGFQRLSNHSHGTLKKLVSDGDQPFYEVEAKTGPGNSGGPAVDAETGEVVGVVTKVLKKEVGTGKNKKLVLTDTTLLVPVAALREAVEIVSDTSKSARAADEALMRHRAVYVLGQLENAALRQTQLWDARVKVTKPPNPDLRTSDTLKAEAGRLHKLKVSRYDPELIKLRQMACCTSEIRDALEKMANNYRRLQTLHDRPFGKLAGATKLENECKEAHMKLREQLSKLLDLPADFEFGLFNE